MNSFHERAFQLLDSRHPMRRLGINAFPRVETFTYLQEQPIVALVLAKNVWIFNPLRNQWFLHEYSTLEDLRIIYGEERITAYQGAEALSFLQQMLDT